MHQLREIQLPLRQKKLLIITTLIGLIIFILHNLTIIDSKTLDRITLFYLIGLPVYILSQDTLIDLNDNVVFTIWLIIGIIHFGIYFVVINMNYKWACGLRGLLCFLLAYKILNFIVKETKGRCLLNTYHQMTWKYNGTGEKISVLDVFFNILLLAVIFFSVLFEIIIK